MNSQTNAAAETADGGVDSGGRVIPLRPDPTSSPDVAPRPGTAVERAETEHAVVAGGALAGGAVEGTVLSAAESAALDRRVPDGTRWAGPVRLLPARAVEVVRSSTSAMVVIRVSVTTMQGGYSWAARLWDAGTHGVYRRQIRAAEATGDQEQLRHWVDAREDAVTRRHQRLRDAPATAWALMKVTAGALAGTIVLVVVVAGVAQVSGAAEFGEVVGGVLDLVRVVAWVIAAAWTPAVAAAPLAVLYAAYREGTRRAELPAWVRPEHARESTGEPITPSMLVIALRELGLAPLRKAIKGMGDAGAGMLGPIRLAGCGVEVDVLLPKGTDTSDIHRRRRKLAENLDRHEHEVHMTIPSAARTVRLWIADSGALDQPIGPSPLTFEPDLVADLYTGRAPWGVDLRGDTVAISLLQRHLLITGLSNQGKTAALRALALWVALDPSTELQVADLKGVGDWRMVDGIATTLIQGPTDDHVIQATRMLESGVSEMERRISALEASGAPDGVTRDMARTPGSGFHPLFLIVDEAQVAFMCPAVGEDKRPYGGTKATSRYFMAARKLQNQGRAVNVLLWQGTQDPTDQNLPKLVREGAHIRASLAVGTEEQACMALGDKAIDAGAAPHRLRQGLDKGVLVVAGDGVPLPPGQAALTVRTHYVNGADAADVADRARALRTAVTTTDTTTPDTPLDPLADIAAVLTGHHRMRTQEVLTALAGRDSRYRGWNFTTLNEALPEVARAYKTGGQMKISATRVHEALTERDEIDGIDTDDD
ncbi:FtsK/SpoIIIE domain-containing protein [Actinokineospora inagensis]|uniref:FtsK/SpoIIIE domain-containing protein n=1 Tax=Actinokineospora inagensis TaxID=103730 RepID=UPI00040771D7|nr:FtsK/SpoIIIE domain-containing protein [Actinokineospora inagensis]